MSHDEKSWEEFNKLDAQNIMLSSMYSATVSKFKSKGSNYTPPKKKRKR